ncbi:hypothetical protein NSZ01_16650 [Nocardioides szechwanensis]|nr:hypothetical protein NSZ01_16650 [Nocardioides szechwanensis]
MVASLAGALGYGYLVGASALSYAAGLLAVIITVVVVAGMVWCASILIRPWLETAVDPDNLRTE